MPELPDVELFRRFFASHAAGRTVTGVEADPTIVRNATPRGLEEALVGRTFRQPGRHGKWLIGWTDGPALLIHFGMTGDLIWSGEEPPRHRHDRLVLQLDRHHELRYRNMRKLGGVWLALDEADARGLLSSLGPDALDVTREEFLSRLGRRRGGLKAALMDQGLVAGVGNLVADEVLWQARLHPLQAIQDLDESERRSLHTTMRRVLRESIEHFDYIQTKRSWLSHVRGRPGAVCPRCRTPLERTVVGGRTTYFCPQCQPLRRPVEGETGDPSREGARMPQ